MLNATVEMFLSEYFLVQAIIGKYLTDGRALFDALGRICLIPAGEADGLYALAENEAAKQIATDKDFFRHQRLRKYSRLLGTYDESDADLEEVVRIKGNAVLDAQAYRLTPETDASANVIYEYLSAAVTGGTVRALQIMGILQCEGIFLDKNEKSGLKKLIKAADWNDAFSILALLHYRTELRAYNIARLRQVTEETPFSALYAAAVKAYGVAAESKYEEVELLSKAFNSGVLKREIYDPKYARILRSKALVFKDKEKAIFSHNKEQLSVIGDLPLKLSDRNITAFDVCAVQEIPLRRNAEIAAVVRALQNSDRREMLAYRPLCLCSDSEYLLNLYARAVSAPSPDVHTERIDVKELTEYDLDPTPNNVFIRCLDEDKDNRLLLFFCGSISEKQTEAVKCILQSGRRSRFHLNSPCFTLKLGTVLPICFCDRQNAARLKPYCDVIELAAVSAEEFPIAVYDILKTKRKLYGTGRVRLNDALEDVLHGFDVDTAEKLIDSAVRTLREKGAEIVLSREILQEYLPNDEGPRMGFGGDINERNK